MAPRKLYKFNNSENERNLQEFETFAEIYLLRIKKNDPLILNTVKIRLSKAQID